MTTSAPPPPPAHLAGFVGEYGDEPGVVIVFEDAGQLWLLAGRGGVASALVPDGARAFLLDGGVGVVFHCDRNDQATAVVFEGAKHRRRRFEPRPGVAYRVRLRAPLSPLRRAAGAATPPDDKGRPRPTDLVELVTLDPSLRLDIRYATRNNFLGAVVYDQARAFLQRPIAHALVRAHRALADEGLGLLVYDAYRPWAVTKVFWDAVPDEARGFVANPAKGSRHNRGAAVDVGLFSLADGAVVPMPSGYDEFSARAYADYRGSTARDRHHRERLRLALSREGFAVHPHEWWHFDHETWADYPIGNTPFSAL